VIFDANIDPLLTFLRLRLHGIGRTIGKDTNDLNLSNYYDTRITIAHFGGKQMANSNAGSPDKVSLSADIVAAYVSRNSVTPSGLPALIESIHQALSKLGMVEPVPSTEALVPAVPIRKSISPGFLICLDDGKKFKSLKRHLASHGMTPDQYRTKWNLPKDYPMTAPDYAAKRSALAKSIGLGQLRKDTAKRKPRRTSKAEAEKVAS
jgi:MucR family transcriptional regulator, transcriptional regulator of exopolysaccharide biosynthesis